MKMLSALWFAVLLLFGTPALATPADDLNGVMRDHWSWYLANNPVFATTLGVHNHDDKLADISLAAQDAQARDAQGFVTRLKAIADATLSAADRTNKGVLLRVLDEQIEGNRYGQRMMLFSTYDGWHQNFASMADNLPLRLRADYESYLTRLGLYPAFNAQAMAITRAAIAQKFVQPCLAMAGFENTITGAVAGPAEATRFYTPFTKPRPIDMSDAQWREMQARALALIRDVVAPEYAKFNDLYVREYKPKCAVAIGASALPQGAAFYAYRARVHTTTDKTPEQIHAIGQSEVTRIRGEMEALAKSAGYPSRAAFITKLRTDPKYFAKTPEELLAWASRQAKIIDGKMPGYFGIVARLPYGVREIPKETAETTTTAYYSGGSPETGLAGNFYVNTSKLDQRPLWEYAALTAHEAVPGHHQQIALQQELKLPDFRKYAVGFTAFVEGWALYSEHLGIEMGLYDTPEKNMGRLSFEMWRACRLVVDTGMHAKNWSKPQAIAFMRENTALSDANIEAEVNRYISWPGQALGYKIGELKIRELRARAESKLGTRFDLRRFHDAMLGQGAVPLDVLERQIDDWIEAEATRR